MARNRSNRGWKRHPGSATVGVTVPQLTVVEAKSRVGAPHRDVTLAEAVEALPHQVGGDRLASGDGGEWDGEHEERRLRCPRTLTQPSAASAVEDSGAGMMMCSPTLIGPTQRASTMNPSSGCGGGAK
jgi:hypothetical protein